MTWKGKERKSIYIVPFILCIVSKSSDMDHTDLPANYSMPAFLRKRSPAGATATRGSEHPIAAYYSFINPQNKRLSWPSWLNYNGRFTHINGHPQAQDRESLPAKDRRSTAVPHNQLTNMLSVTSTLLECFDENHNLAIAYIVK